MNAASIATLILGSSVLGAIIGGWLKNVTEREASFRERLIVASVDFLAAVSQTRVELDAARRSLGRTSTEHADSASEDVAGRALADLHGAVATLWNSIPLLLVVFPTSAVADAARELTEALGNAEADVVRAWRDGEQVDFGQLFRRVDQLHLAYAETARRDIRRGAYASWRLWRAGRPQRDARPIPGLPYRLLGPRALRSRRWQRGRFDS